MEEEFGWSRGVLSLAVGVNLVLFGVTAPFAAALMDRFGIRVVTASALVLVALGSGLTVFVSTGWQVLLLWGGWSALAPGRWPWCSPRRSRTAGSSAAAGS